MTSPSDCRCGATAQKPKPNGTCGTCGGWLPGERPELPWLIDVKDTGYRGGGLMGRRRP